NKSINIKNLSFRYHSSQPWVLQDIDLEIPEGSMVAIVGQSGSGKSTLMKILLRLYQDYEGEVLIDNVNFKSINIHEWRNRCGGVLQDGTILNDTILKNIVLDDEKVNPERLHEVIRLTNLNEFINQTVLKLYTIIGKGGIGISGGQKQRILIARALYKNPDFIFFDEATNSLDTKNEN